MPAAAATGKATGAPGASAGRDLWKCERLCDAAAPRSSDNLLRRRWGPPATRKSRLPVRHRTALWDRAFAHLADAAAAGERRRNWIAPDPIQRLPVPHHTAAGWKAKRCDSWFRLPERQRAAVLHAGDLLAQQFIFDAHAGDHGFEPPSLLVFDVRLAALESSLAARQEAVAPFGEGGRGDAIFPRSAFQIRAAQELQNNGDLALCRPSAPAGGRRFGASSVGLRPPSGAPESCLFGLDMHSLLQNILYAKCSQCTV